MSESRGTQNNLPVACVAVYRSVGSFLTFAFAAFFGTTPLACPLDSASPHICPDYGLGRNEVMEGK